MCPIYSNNGTGGTAWSQRHMGNKHAAITSCLVLVDSAWHAIRQRISHIHTVYISVCKNTKYILIVCFQAVVIDSSSASKWQGKDSSVSCPLNEICHGFTMAEVTVTECYELCQTSWGMQRFAGLNTAYIFDQYSDAARETQPLHIMIIPKSVDVSFVRSIRIKLAVMIGSQAGTFRVSLLYVRKHLPTIFTNFWTTLSPEM